MPHPSFSVEEAVLVQVEAARENNTPRESHGVHVLYSFCRDAGSMERSKYFGYSKDLYHLDHFLNIAAVYPQLFRSDGCAVVGKPAPHEDGSVRVPVVLHSTAGEESKLGACLPDVSRRSLFSHSVCYGAMQRLLVDPPAPAF